MIGNGWLQEPANPPRANVWDIRSRSALRKCMFLPVPPALRDLPPVSPAAMPYTPPRRVEAQEAPIVHPRRPRNEVQMFPAFVADRRDGGAHGVDEAIAKKRAELYAAAKAEALGKHRRPKTPASSPQRWFEDPIALGTLLILLPPVGIAVAWTSKRYSNDARWALTVMTGLMVCLAGAITVALLLRP